MEKKVVLGFPRDIIIGVPTKPNDDDDDSGAPKRMNGNETVLILNREHDAAASHAHKNMGVADGETKGHIPRVVSHDVQEKVQVRTSVREKLRKKERCQFIVCQVVCFLYLVLVVSVITLVWNAIRAHERNGHIELRVQLITLDGFNASVINEAWNIKFSVHNEKPQNNDTAVVFHTLYLSINLKDMPVAQGAIESFSLVGSKPFVVEANLSSSDMFQKGWIPGLGPGDHHQQHQLSVLLTGWVTTFHPHHDSIQMDIYCNPVEVSNFPRATHALALPRKCSYGDATAT